MIIPFFIPHAGCPHQCVFCDQKRITGAATRFDPERIPPIIESYLDRNNSDGPARVAFYGGTFTALQPELQCSYLDAVGPFLSSGRITGIGISTRPDRISEPILELLRERHVDTVELGAQSLDDGVLACSGRGHTSRHTTDSVALLRRYRFRIGLQLMPGLPGDSRVLFELTVRQTISLKPDFVRLYPALVITGTPLAHLYQTGRYAPLSLVEAVHLCKNALLLFQEAGIDVVRVGLQPTEELEREGCIIAGPYHPAFRQVVESSIMMDRMRAALGSGKNENTITFLVNPRDISAAVGQKRINVNTLSDETGVRVRIKSDPSVAFLTVQKDPT